MSDFQRLAEVRARHSSRRRRWLRIVSGLGVAVLLVVVGQLLNQRAGPVDEEARGRVAIVEPTAGLIRVSSGFLGLMSVDLLVTDDTLIVVGDKEGGFGDIRDGGEVRAAYEVRPGTLRAKRVEVVGLR